MKTNDEILENITCCTITEDADLDVKENFYYQYEDVIKAMNEVRKQSEHSSGMKKIQILGIIIGIAAMAMAWIMYDWKLMLIILLALWGNNLVKR
jgi:hypothetical protein